MGKPLSGTDAKYWEKAFDLAEEALEELEVPVGCVLVHYDDQHPEGEIIGTGNNETNRTKNPTRHAEFVAIDEAKQWCQDNGKSFDKVLQESTVYVTLEPCIMCASCLHQLEVQKIVYGANNPRFGGLETVASNAQYGHDHNPEIISGVDAERSVDLLKKFYDMENPNAPTEKRKLKGNKQSSIDSAAKAVKKFFTPNRKADQWEQEKKEAEKAFETEHSGYHRHLDEAEEERRLRSFDERMEETWQKHEKAEEERHNREEKAREEQRRQEEEERSLDQPRPLTPTRNSSSLFGAIERWNGRKVEQESAPPSSSSERSDEREEKRQRENESREEEEKRRRDREYLEECQRQKEAIANERAREEEREERSRREKEAREDERRRDEAERREEERRRNAQEEQRRQEEAEKAEEERRQREEYKRAFDEMLREKEDAIRKYYGGGKG